MRAIPFMPGYTFHFREVDGINVVVIMDKDEGARSVTNGLREVLNEIEASMGPILRKQPIIYLDIQGIFDGIDATCQDQADIYTISQTDEAVAAELAVEYWQNKGGPQYARHSM